MIDTNIKGLTPQFAVSPLCVSRGHTSRPWPWTEQIWATVTTETYRTLEIQRRIFSVVTSDSHCGFFVFCFFSEGIIYKVQPFLNNSYCDLTAMFHTGNVRDNFNTSFHNANVSISALNSVRILFSTWLKLHNIHIPCNKNEL